MSTIFSKEIQGRLFNFQPFEIHQQTSYSVNVKDEDEKRLEFRMEKINEDSWELEGEHLPAWITENKELLVKAIKEHE